MATKNSINSIASASEVNILDGATLDTTELNYVDGVTSAIQTQLNNKAASTHTHVKTDLTDIADFLLESEVDADIKTLSLPASTTISVFGASIIDDADEATFKATVNLEIGTDVQAYDADLTDLATKWTTASASGAASLQFHEDTDNGTHKITLTAPASIASDKTITFPDTTGTVALTSDIPSLTGYVNTTGTPANNQIAIFTDADTVEGDSSLTYDGTSFNLATAKNFQIAGATILADSAGTTTLSNIDALDATTEATIEGAIDTLANLTSIQGRTVTLADAGANAIFGWDDTAGAYENLTQAEARTVLGLGTAAYVATDLADLNEATIESAIDTLANLTSIQGRTVTLADAGANAVFGWDDVAGAYENLTAGEVRGAIGLATTDSPEFTALNIGHASDTTLARSSAGNLSIEGNLIYRAGGTDVPLADGGTGASLSDPNADRIMFWDDSGGAVDWLTVGSGLSISGTTLSTTGGSAEATTKSITQTTHGFAVGDILKYASSTYAKAQADSASNSEVVGIVSAVADANNFTLHTHGYISTLSGLTANTTYFLSASSAGALTSTEPSTAGQISKPLLRAVSTTTGYFFNMRGLVVPSSTTTASSYYLTSTEFSTSGRHAQSTGSSGSITFSTFGVRLSTSTAGNSHASLEWYVTPATQGRIWDGSPEFSTSISIRNAPNSGSNNGRAYIGLGTLINSGGTSIDFTGKHVGFKLLQTSADTYSLYATQGDGSTETASSALTTVDDTPTSLELYLKINDLNSVDYYWRKDGGDWSSATNLTTNLPTTGDGSRSVHYIIIDEASSVNNEIEISGASYKR